MELHIKGMQSPTGKKIWQPIDARKFGCDVSVQQYVLTDSGEGETAWWLIFLQHSSSTHKSFTGGNLTGEIMDEYANFIQSFSTRTASKKCFKLLELLLL